MHLEIYQQNYIRIVCNVYTNMLMISCAQIFEVCLLFLKFLYLQPLYIKFRD
jgi:hypothetical protein